jgi:hypothetical protein
MASGRGFFGELLPHEFTTDTHRCDLSGCNAPAVTWWEHLADFTTGPCPAPRVFGRCRAHPPDPEDLRDGPERPGWGYRPARYREVPEPERFRQKFQAS